MNNAGSEELISKIKHLKTYLSEAREAIEAIKGGSVDAFAIKKDGKSEVFTLQSLDYAYRVLIEKFSEGALNLTPEGLIVYSNSYFSELVGIPNGKVTGSYIFDFIAPESRKLFREHFTTALQGCSKTEINLSVGGKKIPVYISLTSLQPQLPTVGLIITDLSEKKHTEQQILKYQLRLQIQNKIFNLAEEIASIGSYEWNSQNGELVYSDNFFRILGCRPQEFVPSIERYFTFLHPDDKKRLIKIISDTVEKRAPLELTHRIIAQGGGVKHLRITGKVIGEAGKEMLIGTAQDITADILQTEILRIKNLELEHVNKSLDQFASIASHDLQEPLRKIRSFTSLLKDRYSKDMPEDAGELIGKIRGSAERMSLLIKDILNFARIVHSENMYVSTDLNEILNNILSDFDLLIHEKKAIISRQNLPVIEAIPLQMNQLFYNLIGNALKFSRKGVSPAITISSRMISPAEAKKNVYLNKQLSYVEISFRDNGIGFEQQFADQIFSIFERLNNHQQYSGTGIGLALCQKIAGHHQGSIRAEAEENCGAEFYVLLPLTQSANLVVHNQANDS